MACAWVKTGDKSLAIPDALIKPDATSSAHNFGSLVNLTKVGPLISTVFGGVPLR
jgi:hypothetical protein